LIAFGITTQSRKELFFQVLEAVYKYAPDKSLIVINDDASTDGTKEAVAKWILERQGGPEVFLTGSEKIAGVANSKNNLVQQILKYPNVTDVILIEDDVLPMRDLWWDYLLKCAWEHKQAHLLFLPTNYKYGKTVMASPGPHPIAWKTHCSGLIMYFREELLRELKGFETRFGRYGWDHNELTARCLVAQMQSPNAYPHCLELETEHAVLSKDMEAEALKKTLPSSTTDDSPNGLRTKTLLARQNQKLYDELMGRYNAAYLNVQNHTQEEKLAHRTRYYFKKESCP
jgi:glycosyltransferase involved in cell wall biosynthesis